MPWTELLTLAAAGAASPKVRDWLVPLIGMKKSTRRNHTPPVGLARALSKLGYCSRSQAGDLIRAGRVRLNEIVRLDPEAPVRLGKDRIDLDNQQVEASRRVYLMMNKPRGVVTTASDEKGRKTVYDLLTADLPWLAPVGRLDLPAARAGHRRQRRISRAQPVGQLESAARG